MDSNIYEYSATSTIELYADFIDGCPNNIVLVLSEHTLSAAAKTAILSSTERLGYGEDACCWVTLSADASMSDTTLSAAEVNNLIEGMDPAAIVSTDSNSANILGEAYELTLAPNSHTRILGRDVVALNNFEEMLTDSDSKQLAWALLKKMGHTHN